MEEERKEAGGGEGLMVRKDGGSRGNPPCIGPCVSCHWRNARRVPAKDCIVWCMEDTSHVLSFSLSLFPQSQAVSQKRCRGFLVQTNSPTPPPKKKKKRKEASRGRRGDRFENRRHINTFIYLFGVFLPSLLTFCGLWGLVVEVNVFRWCHYHGGHISFPLCLHTVQSACQACHYSPKSPVSQIVPGKLGLN